MTTTVVVLVVVAIQIGAVFHLARSNRMDQRWSGLLAVTNGVILVALVWSHWSVGRILEDRLYFRGIDIPVVGWFAVCLSLSIVMMGVALMIGWNSTTILPAIPALIVITFTSLFLVVCETVSRLIPSFFVPRTVRRLTVDVGAGQGAWLALLVGLAAAASLSGRLPEWSSRAYDWWSDVVGDPRRLAAYFGLITTSILVTCSRYFSWVKTTIAGESRAVPGWAAPFVGPSTLIAVVVTFVGLWIFFTRSPLAGLLVVGVSTSYLAIAGTISFATTTLFDRSVTADWLVGFIGVVDPSSSIDRGAGPLWMFLSSIGLVSCLSYLAGNSSHE